MIFEEVAYNRFIKVFLFIVFVTKELRREVFYTAKGAKVLRNVRKDFLNIVIVRNEDTSDSELAKQSHSKLYKDW
ncbi:hypothetical protein [Flavobacterium notoginsengisoli]|uniref:hypothetical protein n=1 Tax=Flavobacterium notoginsengisoli TaxID=1478199 RepID=UPI0036259961